MPSSKFHYFSLKNLSLRSFSECFLRCLAGALFLQMMAPHIRTDAECQNQDHKDRGGGVRQCLILTVYLKVPDLDRQCLCRAERVERAGRGCQVPVAPAQVTSGSCGVEERCRLTESTSRRQDDACHDARETCREKYMEDGLPFCRSKT